MENKFEYTEERSRFNFEDQDLRILKNILNSPEQLREFINCGGQDFLTGDSRDIGNAVISYYLKFRNVPTKRVLAEKASEVPELKEKFEEFFECIEHTDHSPNEFRYDLNKIKNRFLEQKKQDIRLALLENSNDNWIQTLKVQVEQIDYLRAGKKQLATRKNIKDYVKDFRNNYAEKVKNPQFGRGIQTGYSCIDYVKNGMFRSEMAIIAAESGAGKMLPLDTPIITPDGFKQMGDIHPGDLIFGMDGNQYEVLAESEIKTEPGWKFIFNDGSEIISHDDHLWLTYDHADRSKLLKYSDEWKRKRRETRSHSGKGLKLNIKRGANKKCNPLPTGSIKTTKEIVNSLKYFGENNHSILVTAPLKFSNKKLLIDPYVLGIWLGDGSKNDGVITSADEEIIEEIKNKGYECISKETKKIEGIKNLASRFRFKGLRVKLRQIGVLNNKHIPNEYLFASIEQRIALVQGLMDSDGFSNEKGNCEFTNTNKKLAEGLVFLLNSLGEKCSFKEGVAKLYGRVIGPKWRIMFTACNFEPFKLKRKLDRALLAKKRLSKFRYIIDAIRTEAMPMKCIQVNSPDNLYLAGKNLIPTHNSLMLNNLAVRMGFQQNFGRWDVDNISTGYNVQYFSLEMPFAACFRRTTACCVRVPAYGLRDANLNERQIQKTDRFFEFLQLYPGVFEIVDVPRGCTVDAIESKFLESCEAQPIDIIVVDYLGLLDEPGFNGDDWLKIAHIAGRLHELARMYNIVVLTAVQLNRVNHAKIKDSSEAVGMHRIGRSNSIMDHADIGIQIESRKDEQQYSDFRYHIIKNRDGELASHTLVKNFACSSIEEPELPFQSDSNLLGGGQIIHDADREDISMMLAKYGWGN